MTEKIAFNLEPNGYSPAEVNAYIGLLLENYEELLGHYETRVMEIEALTKELDELKSTPPVSSEPHAEALELLSEATKVATQTRVQAKTRITALVDQTAIHAHRLEDALKIMKDDLDKMYSVLDDNL